MCSKTKLQDLIKEIEDVRIKLDSLICKKQYNLNDSEIINLSELLDHLLSQYYSIR